MPIRTGIMAQRGLKAFILAVVAVALFLQVLLSCSEAKGGTHPESKSGFQEARSVELPAKVYSQIAPNRTKTSDVKIDPKVLASKEALIKVLIETADGYKNADLKYVQKNQVQKFRLGKFVYANLPKSEINKLEKISSIKRVRPDKEYKPLLDVAVPLINTNSFLSNSFNGSGIRVCVLDTGINKTHPALASRVVAEKDFVTADGDGDNPADFHGHGTHVAGIVASTDSTYKGAAFGSGILNAKVFSSTTGYASTSDIMSGIDWCIGQGANILTLSLGGEDEQNDGSDALSQYVDLAADQGKVVTIAAGNSGPSGNAYCRTGRDSTGSSYSICAPGLSRKGITVGSTQTSKSVTTDGLSGFSSRGPTSDLRIKPDVAAPGEWITSANAGYLSGALWTTLGGTSMAAPMVAGLSALILQAKNMSPEEVKALLMNTAVDLGLPGKDNSYGAGRVNASRAFDELSNTVRNTIDNSGYKIHNIFVPSGSREIRATLYWPENYSSQNDVDLYLLDPAGNIRASSSFSDNTDEMIRLSNPSPAGNWKLLVDPFGVNGNQAYSLAGNLGPSDQMYLGTANTSGKTAYHQINVTDSSKKLTVNLDWNFTDENLDIYLYSTSGHLANYSIAVNTTHEEVSAVAPETGIWSVRLVPSNLGTRAEVFYSLSSTSAVSRQILDDTAPNVTLVEPINNKTYNTRNISLAFRAIENLNAFVDCYGSLDNVAYFFVSVQNGSLSTRGLSVSDGAHDVSVTCVDAANNSGNSSLIRFSADSTPPSITFTSASDLDNGVVNRDYTFISVDVVDANTIDSCILEWDSANYSMAKSGSGNSVSCFSNKTDSDGTHRYGIYANDSLGNSEFVSRTVTFDTAPPAVHNYNPSFRAVFSKGVENESFAINYTEANLDAIYFFWRNGTSGNFSQANLAGCESGSERLCSATANLSIFSDGSLIQFYFEVFDKTGASGYLLTPRDEPFNSTIDRIPPNVKISSIYDSQKFKSNEVALNFTAMDNELIAGCSYRLNNDADIGITGNVTFIAAQNNNTLVVSCEDGAGNAGSQSVVFFVDSVPPTISLQSPQNITYNAPVKLDFSVDETNADRVWYELDDTGNITITGNLTFNASDGFHVLYLFANDTVNNVNFASIGFTVDTIPIKLSFVSPTPNNEPFMSGNSIIVNVTTSEVPDSVLLDWNGANETMDGSLTNWSKRKANLADGNHTFRVYTNDSAGNLNATETRWVSVNVTKNMTVLMNNLGQTLSPKNMTVALLNSTGQPADGGHLLSFENYTLQFNISDVLVETANFPAGGLNSSAVINITNSLPAGPNISAAFDDFGGALGSYVWVDLNGLLSDGNFMAKLIFPRVYALYFYLNGTRDAPRLTRILSACDANLSNIPCHSASGNTSTLYLPSFSGGAAGIDTQAPSISISSPASITYSSSYIPLAYAVSDNAAVDSCWYSLNGGPNATLANCANATIMASQGSNTLVVYSNDTSNNVNRAAITFAFTPPTPQSSPSTAGVPGGGSGGGGGTVGHVALQPGQIGELSISNHPAYINAERGRQASYTFAVRNTGNATLHGVKLAITGMNSGWLSSLEPGTTISELKAGEEQSFTLNVRPPADATPKKYTLTLNATSDDGANAVVSSLVFEVLERAKAEPARVATTANPADNAGPERREEEVQAAASPEEETELPNDLTPRGKGVAFSLYGGSSLLLLRTARKRRRMMRKLHEARLMAADKPASGTKQRQAHRNKGS